MVSFLEGLGAFGSGALEGFERGQESAYRRKGRREQEEASSALMKALAPGMGALPQPQMQPGQPSTPMQLPGTQQGQIDMIRQEAIKRGIDPNVALRVAQSEGLGSYVGDKGSSFGPYQLHYGGVAPGGNRVPGLGDEFTKTTGLDARDPGTVPQQIGFALDKAKEGGWGPWHGWKGDPRAGLPGGAGGGPQPPSMPQQGGDWRTFAQRIMRANPNISPGAFMQALQAAQPYMNMESRQEMALLRAQMQGYMEAGRTARFERGEEGKTTRAEMATSSRERIADKRAALSEKLANIKDERLRGQFERSMSMREQNYQLAREKFDQAKSVAGKRQALAELREKHSSIAAEMRNIVLGKSSGMSNQAIAGAAQAAKDFVKSLDDEIKEMETEIKTAERERAKGGATPQTEAPVQTYDPATGEYH